MCTAAAPAHSYCTQPGPIVRQERSPLLLLLLLLPLLLFMQMVLSAAA
jgi:hypothetical protein